MAKALSTIIHGDGDKTQTFKAGDDVPSAVAKSLAEQGISGVIDDEDLSHAGTGVLEIAPGVSAPEDEDRDEEAFAEAVDSIRRKPTSATSGEISEGKVATTEGTGNQRATQKKHAAMVATVKAAEKDRQPVGAAVAGHSVRPRAGRAGAPKGFKGAPGGGAKADDKK